MPLNIMIIHIAISELLQTYFPHFSHITSFTFFVVGTAMLAADPASEFPPRRVVASPSKEMQPAKG